MSSVGNENVAPGGGESSSSSSSIMPPSTDGTEDVAVGGSSVSVASRYFEESEVPSNLRLLPEPQYDGEEIDLKECVRREIELKVESMKLEMLPEQEEGEHSSSFP